MNSRWGFDLDMSAVRLMRREGGHWREVALEKIDGPDIEDRLMAMVGQLEPGTAVDLFLPREQILYTDVKISSESAAARQIAAAMDGRTPYSLTELELDWVMTDPGTARVAAIARETLDEAAAFAEVRGLKVAGFSSLADPDDFPRLPAFGDVPDTTADDDAPDETWDLDDDAPAVAFTSVREPRPTEILTLSNPQPASDGPVIRVEDSTPVMQVKPRMAPLDPGRPLDNMPSAPRIRTDIASGALSGAAATLTPPGPSIRIRPQGSRPLHTLAIFATAAVLTVGIAVVVWSILPLAPGETISAPTEDTETGLATQTEAPPDTVATAEPVPDLPEPEAAQDVAALGETPAADAEPQAPQAAFPEIARTPASELAAASPDATLLPQTSQSLERRPDALATLLSVDPIQGLDGSEDSAETTLDIYLASVERRDLAFDAIALPDPASLDSSDLPLIAPAPAAPGETVDLASTDPTLALPEETAPDVAEPALSDAETTAPDIETAAELPAADLRPTALAAALPDRAPRARPVNLTENVERQTFGGRTREELARVEPKPRPQSAQTVALTNREAETEVEVSDLAVTTSIQPRIRPQDFDAIVAAAVVSARAEELTASVDFDTPDTSAAIEAALAEDAEPEPRPQDTPRLAIPSGASVSRQATIENAIPLNKINLVGVYGVPSDRRALVRLPSGRYVKVKVGDRVDGGTVAQINDSELIYRKGSRTLSLALPKG